MNGTSYALIFIFLILNVRSFAGETNEWNVRVARLQILAPVLETDTNHSEQYIRRVAKDHATDGVLIPGVTVSFYVTARNGEIADVDDADWSLDSVTDDTGKNLLATVPWEKYYPPSEYGKCRWSFTTGGPSVFVTIRAPGLPSTGATALKITGKISVQTATGSEQLVAANAKLKAGAELNLGDMKLTVSDVEFMGKEFSVMLESKQDLSSISTFKFFDRWGREIKCDEQGCDYSKDQGLSVCTLKFKKRVDNVKIIATRWTGFKSTEVPITIKTGLGLE